MKEYRAAAFADRHRTGKLTVDERPADIPHLQTIGKT
jgi:hypothetical protein